MADIYRSMKGGGDIMGVKWDRVFKGKNSIQYYMSLEGNEEEK